MDIYAYNLNDEVVDFFNAKQLIVVSRALKSSRTGNWGMHRNKQPATKHFSNVTVMPVGQDSFQLLRSGKFPVGYMEKTDQGGLWRLYNKPNPEDATMISLLVEGDATVDLYHANPAVRITEEDGITTVENISELNEMSYKDVKNNVDIQGIGCMWYMRNVKGLDYKQGGYIANGNKTDLNRGSGRLDFCKLTERTDVPETTDFEGNTDLNTFSTDYVYTEEDRLDSNREYLSLILYHGVKQTVSPLHIAITKIL